MSSSSTNAILFLGATGGCGRSALQLSLDAGYTCIALARTPATLLDIFPSSQYPNLRVAKGNAHDKESIRPLLTNPADPFRPVDHILFSIGARFVMSEFAIDDCNVCEKGIVALIDALAEARSAAVAALPAGSPKPAVTAWRPRLTVISTTGISRFGNDVPILMLPLYKVVLKTLHKDKKLLETALYEPGGRGMQERWTIVRPSLLVNGATSKQVRVGVEDPINGWETKANGYTISREDVGRWIFENIVQDADDKWVRKTATVSW